MTNSIKVIFVMGFLQLLMINVNGIGILQSPFPYKGQLFDLIKYLSSNKQIIVAILIMFKLGDVGLRSNIVGNRSRIVLPFWDDG